MTLEINSPRVFLSHSTRDREFVERLCEDFRRCHIDYWVYTEAIRPGKPWLQAIFKDGIPACDCLLVYITSASLASKMVEKEIDAGLIQQLEDGGMAFLPYVRNPGLRKELRKDIQSLQVPVWNEENYEELLPEVISEIWRAYYVRSFRDTARLDYLLPVVVFPTTLLKHCFWVFKNMLNNPSSGLFFKCDAQITRTDTTGNIVEHTSHSSVGYNVCDHEGEVLWTSFPSAIGHHPFEAALRSRRKRGDVLWVDRGYTLLERPIKARDSVRICLLNFQRAAGEYCFLEIHQEIVEPLDPRILPVLARIIPERLKSIRRESEQDA